MEKTLEKMTNFDRRKKEIGEYLSKKEGLKLHVGCGNMAVDGCVNLDLLSLKNVDVVGDFLKLPFKYSSFDFVFSRYVLEHIDNVTEAVEELWRVTKESGSIEVHVPHASSTVSYADPTHKSFFTLNSFNYFTKGYEFNYYSKCRFEIVSKKLQFAPRRFRLLNFISGIVNSSKYLQVVWENLLCWILPMRYVVFVLKPVKEIVVC